MTTEVAILNQRALVFAADSATTVRYWTNGAWQTRYFKGANKLFELSRKQPIGLMIYSNAALHDIPWEILIKEFRSKLADEACGALSAYADRFFGFIKEQETLFPESVRAAVIKDASLIASYRYINAIKHRDTFKSAQEADKGALISEGLRESLAALSDTEVPAPFSAEAVTQFVDKWQESIGGHIARIHEELDEPTRNILTALSLTAVIKKYREYLDHTGVVIGGFGDESFFPGIEIFDCYGFLDNVFIAERNENSFQIDRERTAAIEPFATTSMINTFRMGISPDVFDNVITATRAKLSDVIDAVLGKVGAELEEKQISTMIDEAMDDHQKKWFHPSLDHHYDPLARVVGALPVTDMAALAKSLIELQSLKERVTKSSESVSGPIDVAVISKHDGFVWIERKHYFPADLNPRFFSRQKI